MVEENIKIGILGYGEVGQAIAKFYNSPLVKDLNRDDDLKGVDVLNICIPYTDEFIAIVKKEIEEIKPKLVIVHSTVAPGTIKEIGGMIVHSPIRGIHPHLYEGIKEFVKYIGADNETAGNTAKDHLEGLGLKVKIFYPSITTELGKLFSTSYYGLCIAWHGEMKEMCDKAGVNFAQAVTDFNETYNETYPKLGKDNVVRPVLYPPQNIGGHCIASNAEILNKYHQSQAFNLINKYKNEKFKKLMNIENKTILITGGTGSFGQKFTEVILKQNPKSVRIYDNRELAAVEMNRKFNDPRLRFFIGDVRDKNRLSRAMREVDIVIHAAALKHVTVCEYNPIEAVRTNMDGAVNVIDAAIDNSVSRVMVISTDKAVYPVNLYGATKMAAEKLFVQGNSYVGEKNIMFSCVRYGNVLASSGSVIPLFQKQKEEGEVTITDENMTRFWITLEEGVNFVIKCIAMMKGGEIFVPKISSMKVIDLAEAIAPEAKKKIIGIRSGEKLHEILLTREEAKHTKEFDGYFIIEPEYSFWSEDNFKNGNCLAENFEYKSNNNNKWINKEQMKGILKNL